MGRSFLVYETPRNPGSSIANQLAFQVLFPLIESLVQLRSDPQFAAKMGTGRMSEVPSQIHQYELGCHQVLQHFTIGEWITLNSLISLIPPTIIRRTANFSGRGARKRVSTAVLYLSQSVDIDPLFSLNTPGWGFRSARRKFSGTLKIGSRNLGLPQLAKGSYLIR